MSDRNKLLALLGLALVLPIIAAYGAVTEFTFVNFDDDAYVFNSLVTNWAGQSWSDRLLTPSLGYPLAIPVAIYAAIHALGGLDASLFHTANLILHILNALLVFALLLRVVEQPWAAFTAAAIWAFHPVTAEPVSWVTGLKELTLTAGFVGAVLAADQWTRNRSRTAWVLVALIAAAISLLSKPTAAVVGMVIVAQALVLRRNAKHPIGGPFALGMIITALGLALLSVSYGLHESYGGQGGGFWPGRMAAAATVQLQNYLVPLSLSVLYRPEPPEMLWYVAPVVFVFATFLALRVRNSHPAFVFGLVWILLTWIPVSNIVFVNRFTADSYAYLPSIGFAICVGEVLHELWQTPPSRAVKAVLGLLLVGLLTLTHVQSQKWRDSASLWASALERYPDEEFVRMKLGQAAFERGAFGTAIELFESIPRESLGTTVAFPPRWGVAYCQLGNLPRCMEILDDGLAAQHQRTVVAKRDHDMWRAIVPEVVDKFRIPPQLQPARVRKLVTENSAP